MFDLETRRESMFSISKMHASFSVIKTQMSESSQISGGANNRRTRIKTSFMFVFDQLYDVSNCK